MTTPEPVVAWIEPRCVECGWRGVPSRTPDQLAALPADCPDCGGALGGAIVMGTWRAFSLARVAALRAGR